jgi:hypothetical protein
MIIYPPVLINFSLILVFFFTMLQTEFSIERIDAKLGGLT